MIVIIVVTITTLILILINIDIIIIVNLIHLESLYWCDGVDGEAYNCL